MIDKEKRQATKYQTASLPCQVTGGIVTLLTNMVLYTGRHTRTQSQALTHAEGERPPDRSLSAHGMSNI